MDTLNKQVGRILFSGAFGGAFCAMAILSFADLIGRSGDTGTEYVGYWNPATLVLASIYGGIVGAVFYPVGWFFFSRHTRRSSCLQQSSRFPS